MHENTPEHLRNAMDSLPPAYEVPKSAVGKLPHDPPPRAPPRKFEIRDRTFPDEDYEYLPNIQEGNKDSFCTGPRIFWSIVSILNILILVTILSLYMLWGIPGSSVSSDSIISKKYAPVARDSSKCSLGYSWFDVTGFCYRVSVTASSYERASKECHSEGGHVASIHSPDENDFAVNLYKSTLAEYRHEVDVLHKRADLRIGLVYDKDSWGWSDGTTMNYTNWAENEPNRLDTGEFCTHIGLDEIAGYNPDGDKWNNIGSTYQAAYICKKKSL